MTSIPGRSRTAMLVIDMQRGVVADAYDSERVIATIQGLVEKARAEDVPIVWVQHSDDGLVEGSAEWEYVPELSRADDEPLVQKHYGDSFEGTGLEQVLAERGVGRLVVTGAQTDACIRSTLHGAMVRGYDTVLVEDAHTTEDLRPWGAPIGPEEAIAYTNLYWRHSSAPGRTAATATAEAVDFTQRSA